MGRKLTELVVVPRQSSIVEWLFCSERESAIQAYKPIDQSQEITYRALDRKKLKKKSSCPTWQSVEGQDILHEK